MKKIVKVILGVIAALIVIGLLANIFSKGKKDGAQTKAATESTDKDSAKGGTSDNAATTPAAEEHWSYEEEVDKMTSKKLFYASTTSTNTVEFKFPYQGGSTFTLNVMNREGKNEIAIQVSKGQFMSSLGGNKSVKVKFDSAEPVNYNYSSASDGSSNIIFLSNASKFITNLKGAKKLMVEAEFFNAGSKVLEFDVAGLKWDK
ncbi:MAG: hypothetical protein J0I41_18805 [Filimonas sp.]|nr:hypothetical protein [Filimonas sp.]